MRAQKCCLLGMIALALSACASRDSSATSAASQATASPPVQSAATSSEVYAGWYMQHEGQATFQPCGEASVTIGDAADITTRARSFGVTDDNPVYVRLRGTLADGRIDVASVEQFGSAEPVANCSMTGTMTP